MVLSINSKHYTRAKNDLVLIINNFYTYSLHTFPPQQNIYTNESKHEKQHKTILTTLKEATQY